jgi:hypothetical protein
VTTTTVESFHVAGARAGALVRVLSPGRLETLSCFDLPEGPMVRLHHVFDFEPHPLDWTRFSYHDDSTGTVQVGERRDGEVIVDGDPVASAEQSVLPSYASWLLVQEMLAGDERRLDYLQINEGGTGRELVVATLTRDDAAGTITLVENDVPRNTFWVSDGQVTRSDWGGAESYPADDLSSALDGLSTRVVDAVRSFL